MGSWVMAVEMTPSALVAVDLDRADATPPRPRTVPLATPAGGADGDAVDELADAFMELLGATPVGGPAIADRPVRLVVATPSDTERRRFEEIAEATALVGLPAPDWLPGPVALVGDRIASEVDPGTRSVVIDARGGTLTAWPVRRTPTGADIGGRGPVATGTRLDQLLLGVVRAQLRSLAPGETDPASDARGDAARLRREVRRARLRLSGEEVGHVEVALGPRQVRVDRGVFGQLVEHALTETMTELAGAETDPAPRPRVHVLADAPTPLARLLAGITAEPGAAPDQGLVVPLEEHDAVLRMAALLVPERPRRARAASGAQAIRAARSVGAPPRVGAGVGPGGGASTPPPGVPVDDGSPFDDDHVGADGLAEAPHGEGPDGRIGPEEDADGSRYADPRARDAGDPTAPDDEPRLPRTPARGIPSLRTGAGIPAARVPSTPVQARHDPGPSDEHLETSETSETPEPPGSSGPGTADGPTATGHAVFAGARPHEPGPAAPVPPSTSTALARRPADTSPQPVTGPAGPPRGAVPVLVTLLVLVVLAAIGVLVIGPDQIDAAFRGLGAGLLLLR